jgi:hypothetical protein
MTFEVKASDAVADSSTRTSQALVLEIVTCILIHKFNLYACINIIGRVEQ